MLSTWKHHLKNSFVAGLLVVIPLATTIWLVVEVATWSIEFLTSIPKQFNPIQGLHPFLINLIDLGVGILAPLTFILLIGFMARNIVGQWLLDVSERLLHAIPVAGLVYRTLKQLLSTVLDSKNRKFRRVVLLEYPRPGVWALGFVTGSLTAAVGRGEGSQTMLNLFVPTTPNPTTGWYALVPESETIELFMPVEDAFKMLISGGIVMPETFVAAVQGRPLVDSAVGLPNLRDLTEREREFQATQVKEATRDAGSFLRVEE
ncbi:MAG: DUF502 domain-containing protein [Synechococcaceae cyanobacterium SM2_3_2]|nr:DUF502 domain-containing protein [Synechococcaceae cyanobacterium SM2_3_2]